MGRLTDLRDQAYTRLRLNQINNAFVLNDFDTHLTYIPYAHLSAMAEDHPNGKVYVVSSGHGDTVTKTRTNLGVIQEIPVQIGFQKTDVDYDDIASLDVLTELVEELQDMCRKEVLLEGYSFNRIDVMKDEEDVPFSYVMLREARTFEAYFTAIYQLVLS